MQRKIGRLIQGEYALAFDVVRLLQQQQTISVNEQSKRSKTAPNHSKMKHSCAMGQGDSNNVVIILFNLSIFVFCKLEI
jgi:hypothetical protein